MPTAAQPKRDADTDDWVKKQRGEQHGSLDEDTRHHVIVDFRGAPIGTRTQMAEATGPGTATVKTSYALAGV